MGSGELEQITGHYESGRLFVARAACRRILDRPAADPESLRQVALIALRSGDATTAAEAMTQALRIRPDEAEYHNILGNAQRKLGALADSVCSFRRATELAPHSAEAYNNLGACLQEQNDLEAAIVCFQRALQLDPFLIATHYNLGNLHQVAGRLSEAIACYQSALQIDPAHVDSHTNLGAAFFQQGRYEESIWHYRRALEVQPENPEALNNLGTAYLQQKNLPPAVECFHRALDLDEHYWEARANLGDALQAQHQQLAAAAAYGIVLTEHPELHDVRNKLGTIWNQLGELERAEACFRKLVQQLPDSAAAWNNLGVTLHLQGKNPAAITCYERAFTLSGGDSESSINLATAFREQGDFRRSLELYEHALTLQGNLSRAHRGLGDVLTDRRELEAAHSHYERAIELAPDDAENRLQCAMSFLRLEDFVNGWREFEWRWQTDPYRTQLPSIRQWTGEPLNGQTILIQGEQGLGDTIQFSRYLAKVKRCGGRVIFACPDRLIPIMEKIAGADQIIPLGAAHPVSDFFAPLLSLPAIFHSTTSTIPVRVPYLFADDSLIAQWRAKLRQHGGLKIGVCWQGNPAYRRDRYRSIPPEYFLALSDIPDVTVVSLQKGTSHQSFSADKRAANFLDLSDSIDQMSGPFMDTAAIMKSLDVVITCDTSLAHLAGALGVEVWVALEFAADWRWLLDREDSVWYPTMRLFRQLKPGDWDDVFQRIRQSVQDMARPG